MTLSKKMLWTTFSVVPPHPVRIPDSNLRNKNLKSSCHMYRCSASFRIGWASSLFPNKPQIKLNNGLFCLQSMANFENAELDCKERKKKPHLTKKKPNQTTNPKKPTTTKKSKWGIKNQESIMPQECSYQITWLWWM